MNASRWSHQLVEIKPRMFGISHKREIVQAELDRMGNQGWELVSVAQGNGLEPIRLYFKRPG